MQKHILLILIILFSLIQPISSIYFKQIGMKEGLSQVSVMSIYQDELGRMWFGTLEGLNMYDGNSVTVFKPTESGNNQSYIAVENNNRHITGNGKGLLYLNSDNRLLRYDSRLQTFTRLRENVNVVKYVDGRLHYGSGDAVFIYNEQNSNSEFLFTIEEKDAVIQTLLIDSRKRYWIGSRKGVYLKEENQPPIRLINNEDIFDIYEDIHKNIWIASHGGGIHLFNRDGSKQVLKHIPNDTSTPSSNQIRCFTEDNYGNIWIGTFSGLNKYNVSTQQFTYYTSDRIPGSLTYSSIFSLYKDYQGTIWIGSYYGGVNYFNPETNLFNLYTQDRQREDCLSFSFVGNMVEDKNENIWICTEGGGLNFFNRKTRTFRHIMADGTNRTVAHNNLKSICYSHTYDKLFIGTHRGGLSIYDIEKDLFRNLSVKDHLVYPQEAGTVVNKVGLYKDEILIFLTQNGIYKMDLATEAIDPLIENAPSYTGHNFFIDSKGYIWLIRRRDVLRINLTNQNEQESFSCGSNGLGEYDVTTIFEDRKGRIYFGTLGSGIYQYNPDTGDFKSFTTAKYPLLSDYCYNISQSIQGYLLISSDKGLVFLNPDDYDDIQSVELFTSLPISGINLGCGLLVSRNGEIFVGGIDGLTTFFEQELFNFNKKYDLYFSDLYLHNEIVIPGDKHSLLKEALAYTKEIDLSHTQNNIRIDFTSNNYIVPLDKSDYEYMLEGFDEKWINYSSSNISYNNLNPGKYVLTVRETMHSPGHSPQMIQMNIRIRSPWYASIFAYILYSIILIGTLYIYLRSKHAQLLLRTSLEMERKEKERIEELNKTKLQFFSNVSHEFRTPLTLIISQIEVLLQSNALVPFVYNKLIKIYKNTYHMRNLINELLDFRKLEQGFVKLKVYEQDLLPFIKEIYYSFYEYASSHSINYSVKVPEQPVLCWFDPKQLQKVINNLLANAFKYTQPNGTIEIVIEEEEKEIAIKVIDSGTGIENKDIDKIFERFYQADNELSKGDQTTGTGIGLSLCKSLVELHHGTIQVESTAGYGSIFIVRLKKGNSHFNEEICEGEEIPQTLQDKSILNEFIWEEQKTEVPKPSPSKKEEQSDYTILIVEDHEELLQLLESVVSPLYKSIIAKNGKEALELAKKIQPDLIISDVMMPEMTGSELCVKIKNDFELCHIPFVMLTALTSPEHTIEGFQRGADAYINKPFNSKVLLAHCNNLIRNRLILQKKFSGKEKTDNHTLTIHPMDQKFMEKIENIIEQNLDNTEFDMAKLARKLGLGRSSLYAKFKALTGMTPNEYALNYKLNKAAQLLREQPDRPITELADQLGFGSPRYFTRCFKNQFNITPADYRKEKKS